MIDGSNTVIRHNPDILTCLANLSADEVFTPPKLVEAMLDQLPQELFQNPETTFLDPFCKSGVFLREIASRLNKGLRDQMPDDQARVNHILTKQVFGLATSELTSAISRRSLYYSKKANGKYSVCTAFTTYDGNVRLPKSKHRWNDSGKCEDCGARRMEYDRGDAREAYAYPFIHGINPEDIFNMKFDVIIGNPPYQLSGAAGGSSDASIYHLFVLQAFKLAPRFATFVIPSRWMAGGRGLNEFRELMLACGNIKSLTDYPDASDAFPGVQIKGGVCYFLWEKEYSGTCNVTRISGREPNFQPNRNLGEFDVFIRDERAVGILRKVLAFKEPSILDMISGDTPFGLATNFDKWTEKRSGEQIELHLISQGKRFIGYVDRNLIRKNCESLDVWKVLIPEAYGAGESLPHQILGKEIVARPPSACTQSFLVVSPFSTESEAGNFSAYYRTRFFRFLVWLRKITQHALRSTYSWVPMQSWEQPINDQVLYKKYGFDDAEILFIESVVREMEGVENA